MAYSSDIDLPLGQEPQSSDTSLFPDLLDIYNSIHLLAQYTDKLIKNQTSGGPEQKPWEAMPFRNWFYAVVGEDVAVGNIVTPIKVGLDFFRGTIAYDTMSGIYMKGAPCTYLDNAEHTTWGNGMVGFVLEAQTAGNLCKIGVGPAIVNIPGCRAGEALFAKSFFNGETMFLYPPDGLIYRYPGNYMAVIGACVADDAAMIWPYPDFWTGNAVAYKYPNPSGTGGEGE